MERELRRKFICISFGVVVFVLAVIAIVINIVNYMQVDERANEIITLMAENDGTFPKDFDKPMGYLSAETPYATRYFIIRLDENNQLISTDTRSIQLVSTQQAVEYATIALSESEDNGFLGNYKYQITETGYGSLLIFIDCSEELSLFHAYLRSSIQIVIVALICIFVLLVWLSKKAVFPIAESYRRQQQFITNITHELKTPLAIMKTNTEVIELEHESSQWSESIHHQITRLNELINYLVSLSKLEEGEKHRIKIDFPLSDVISEEVDTFHVLAESTGRSISQDITPRITYRGDEQEIRLLISILMNNALKYSSNQASISVKVKEHLGKIKIQVTNPSDDLEIKRYDELFGRFYRMEGSRNSELGGFGVGLAIAKAIVKHHGGSIHAESKDGTHMVFTIRI